MAFLRRSLLIPVLILTGCITTREGPIPSITEWPIGPAAKTKTIAITINNRTFHNNEEICAYIPDRQDVCLPRPLPDDMVNTIVKAYNTSGLFSSVRDASLTKEADVKAVVTVETNYYGSTPLALLNMLTIGMVPYHELDKTMVNTTFEDTNGNLYRSSQYVDSSSTWIWLLLLPATPFYRSSDIFYDLNRQIILDAHHRGLF